MQRKNDRIRAPKKTQKLTIVSYSKLQVCILSIMRDGAEHNIHDLSQNVYKLAGKRRPPNAEKSITDLIRSTNEKLNGIDTQIESLAGTGRGNFGRYILRGDLFAVKQTIDRMILQ